MDYIDLAKDWAESARRTAGENLGESHSMAQIAIAFALIAIAEHLEYAESRDAEAKAHLAAADEEAADPAYAEYNKIRQQSGLSPLGE